MQKKSYGARRPVRRLALLAVAGVVLPVGLLGPVQPATADSPLLDRVLDIQVENAEGKPALGADVTIAALPRNTDGDTIVLENIGAGTVDEQGRVVVTRQDRDDLSAFRGDDGEIELELQIKGEDGSELAYSISVDAEAVAPEAVEAGDPVTEDEITSEEITMPEAVPAAPADGVESPEPTTGAVPADMASFTIDTASEDGGTTTEGADPDTPGTEGTDTGGTEPEDNDSVEPETGGTDPRNDGIDYSGSGASGQPRATTCSGGQTSSWKRTSTSANKNVPVIWFRTRERATAKYDWSTTKKTKLSTAYQAGNQATVKSGQTSSVNEASGVKFNAENWRRRYGKAEWRYFKYQRQCTNHSPQYVYMVDAWSWRPYNFTGGNTSDPTDWDFTCQAKHKIKIQNTLWVARDISTTFSAGFTIGGAGLDSTVTNTTSTKLTINPDGTDGESGTYAYLCGNNSTPTGATRVKEE